jgi:hypothetical protein
LLSAPLVLLINCALLAAEYFPLSRKAQRLAAQQRWSTRALGDYRVALRVESASRICFQEVEVRGSDQTMLRDTCNMFWLSALSVSRLFELGSRLERNPECSPSSQNCVCQRVRAGQVVYDNELGFPSEVALWREVRPNLAHLDYWRRLWKARAIPPCNSSTRGLRLIVVSLTPLR